MIWESVVLMSTIDLLVVASVIYLIWIFMRHHAGAARFGLQNAIGVLIGGCVIVGVFYAGDLVTMHLVPRFATRELGRTMMTALHLNYSWIAFPLAMAAVAVAVVLMLTRLIPAAERWVDELETTREQLRQALENTEAEVAARTRELEEARALLSAALDQSPSGILIARAVGPELEFLAFNRAARKMVYGSQADQYVSSPVRALPLSWKLEQADGSAVDREQFPIVRAAVAGQPTNEFEGRIRREDGSVRWMLSNGVPVVDEAGERIAGLSVFSDITRFKELEQLNNRRLEFETMLRQISDEFINPSVEGFDHTLQLALDELREFVAADRSYLILLEPRSDRWRFAHESVAEGIKRQRDTSELNIIEDAQSPWFFAKARAGETVILNDLSELAAQGAPGADREFYARWGVGAELGVPMLAAGEVIGIVGVEMEEQGRQWAEYEVRGIELISRVFADAIAKKGVDDALRESERLFRAVVDNLPIGLNLKDTDHRVVLLNRTFKDWLGASESWTGRKISEELLQEAPGIEGRRIDQEKAVLNRGEVINREEEMVFADGSRHFLEIKKFPVTDTDGRITAVGSAAVDITERKKIEQELAKSERLFRTVLDNLPIGVNLKDHQDRFIVVNPTYAEWYGVTANQLLGHTPEEAFPDREKLDSRRKAHELEVIESGVMVTREEATERSDGKKQHLLIQKFPVVLASDVPVAIGTAAIDITARQLADMEVRRLNENLEQRVVERTRQLEATNKELESFSYSVSHDLRAPLRHITGFIELLQNRVSGDLDSESSHYLEAIADSAGRMETLIDNLLHFSRVGRAEMNPSPVEVKALIDDVIREFDTQESGRKIIWRMGDLPMVRGDRVLLKQIFVNLISNALKFTRDKKPAEIEIGTTEAKQSKSVIYVRDNGVGFDMQYAYKLFGVFQRLHGEEEFEGTGIGLANVERIVQRHGGRVWGEANADGGATFYVSLPLAEETTT